MIDVENTAVSGKRSDGRVAVITGGSSGIGRAAAEHFASRGWKVGLIARSKINLDAACAAIKAAGGAAVVAAADVANSTELEQAAAVIEKAFGPIDVWINCAGVFPFGRFVDLTEEDVRRTTEVNYLGSANGIRIALARMMPRDRGTIVQITSTGGCRGWPMQTAYTASKWALRGLVEGIRAELIHDRSAVRLVMVHPPSTNTPIFSHLTLRAPKRMSPIPPLYAPSVTAKAIYWSALSGQRDNGVVPFTPFLNVVNFLVPGLLDIIAGRFGIEPQQTDMGARAVRDPNLTDPGREPSAVTGPFGDLAADRARASIAIRHPVAIKVGIGAIVLSAVWLWQRHRATP